MLNPSAYPLASLGDTSDQCDMFQEEYEQQLAALPKSKAHTEPIDVLSYDRYIVAMSGGKDSVACLLHLLECGVPRDLIEIHHHNVDGEETGEDGLMDRYCGLLQKAGSGLWSAVLAELARAGILR